MRWLIAVALLLSATRGNADLATADDWGDVKIALTFVNHETGERGVTFALYSSGRVLIVAHGGHDTVQLTPAEAKALVTDLHLDSLGAFSRPPRPHDAGATLCVSVWTRGVRQRDCVWGSPGHADQGGATVVPASSIQRPFILQIWTRLADFSSPRQRPWRSAIPHQAEMLRDGDATPARR